jgi:hypothetical protein
MCFIMFSLIAPLIAWSAIPAMRALSLAGFGGAGGCG